MTEDEVMKVLKTITYKPNWKLQFFKDPQISFSIAMHVRMEVPDVRLDAIPEPITIIINHKITPAKYEFVEELYNDVFNMLMALEKHEAQEWFKVDGVAHFNPHKAPFNIPT